uniref:Uncharacterized protein n=1 Tax=Oryza glumipatula TaxID=40148 RepID=A0A0E0APU2_9ORYZ
MERGQGEGSTMDQLSGDPPLYNGTSYLFDTAASSCRTFQFPVGILPRSGETPWTGSSAINFLFSRYYADVATGRPVRWIFNGNTRHVLVFEAGVILQVAGAAVLLPQPQ